MAINHWLLPNWTDHIKTHENLHESLAVRIAHAPPTAFLQVISEIISLMIALSAKFDVEILNPD